MNRKALISALFLLLASSPALAESQHENYFASIFRSGKKIGQIHYTITVDDIGEIEELRTKVSISLLGVKVYSFTQHLHEQWSQGELQKLTGTTDDNGKKIEVALTRTAKEYEGDMNGNKLTLPHDAFPRSPWHYEITKHQQLIDLTDLHLQNVKIEQRPEQISAHGKTLSAERFDFTGDWEATLWYDEEKRFLKANFTDDGNEITVEMDP